MPAKRAQKNYRKVRGIRLDQQEWIAYRLSILHGYNARGLAAMYTKLFHITVPQWRVLTVIGRHAPASASKVAGLTSLEPDKITRAVDSLVKLGFVHRKPDPRDKRFVVLTLSIKGKRVNGEIEKVRNAMELELAGALKPDEIEALYGLLDKLQLRAAEIFKHTESWRDILAKHLRDVSDQDSLGRPAPERGARTPVRKRATSHMGVKRQTSSGV
jgi:DNA-binding MarR family transcriptional regulator